jgi:hypothetical protein
LLVVSNKDKTDELGLSDAERTQLLQEAQTILDVSK